MNTDGEEQKEKRNGLHRFTPALQGHLFERPF